jgi:hypothetical protein
MKKAEGRRKKRSSEKGVDTNFTNFREAEMGGLKGQWI